LKPQDFDELTGDVGFDTAQALTDSQGRFSFYGVPPGRYWLRGLKAPRAGRGAPPPSSTPEQVQWIKEEVTVGDADVTVNARFRAGLRVSGRFEFIGSAPVPAGQRLRQTPIVLDAADGRSVVGPPLVIDDLAARFTTAGVPAGRYFVRTLGAPPGWTFQGATFEGRDVSDAPLELSSTDISGVVVTFTTETTTLSGAVVNANGRPDRDAVVLVCPSEPAAWIDFGESPRRLRSARADTEGRFSISGLPENDYLAIAIDDAASGNWQERSTLERLRGRATRVRVGAGATTLNLTTVR
jgi:hypothetical protein